jgi:hypothetical protein
MSASPEHRYRLAEGALDVAPARSNPIPAHAGPRPCRAIASLQLAGQRLRALVGLFRRPHRGSPG